MAVTHLRQLSRRQDRPCPYARDRDVDQLTGVGREVLSAARARRIDFVDASVAGQKIRAESGTLSIYAGGSKKAFARLLPVLEAVGDPMQIFHLGPAARATRSSCC
jgi:hypothetical protein